MASIDNVVGFNIVIQDAAPSRSSFGTIAVIAHNAVSPDRLVYDTTPDGRAAMIVDGFPATHDAYRKNAAIGSQSPKVPRIKVYNRAAPNAQALTLTPTLTTPGRKYQFELNGVAISHTNGASETPTTISNAFRTQITAAAAQLPNVTAGGTATVTLSLTSASGARMYLKNVPRYLTVKDTSPDAGIATDLANALLEDSDFYGVLIDSMSEAEINAAAAWCQANGKLFHGQSIDSDILTNSTTDVCSDLKAAGYSYAKAWYSRDMPAQLAAEIMGREFSQNPGSTTWENKRLSAIVPDDLQPTEITNARGKNCGLFLRYGENIGATHNTAAAGGRFLDLTRDSDWLAANAKADVFTFLLNQEKAPFTQPGIDSVEGVLRARFALAEQAGVLDAGWDITLPTIGQIDPADKVLRLLVASDSFAGVFQGAIHGVQLSGVLAV
jgi:hypothetical protein